MNEITASNAKTILQDLEKAFWDIPFDNSKFQTEMFVIAAQITPERAYRTIGLQMFTKLSALQEAEYQRQMDEIKKDELQYQINDPQTNQFDRRRAELELAKLKQGAIFQNKLENDLIKELNLLYENLQKFPTYTGEQFEAAERIHFEQRLLRETNGLTGAALSLINMREDITELSKYQEQITALPNVTTEQMQILLSNMANKIVEKNNVNT
jgi:hypothetical protein